jgi:Spy/CpxP family protein refolding chaperone
MKGIRSFAVLALVAAPVSAQQPGMMGRGMMPHMMQMQEMMAPMMRGMAFAPNHLLERKDSLGLTAPQVARLTALRDAAKTAHDAAHAGAKAHMDAMAQAFQAAAPDTNAVKQHFQAAHAAMGKAHWTMLAAAAQAKALLTDEQRARVERWASTMMEHH